MGPRWPELIDIIRSELNETPYISSSEIAKKYNLKKRTVEWYTKAYITIEDRLSGIKIKNKNKNLPPNEVLAYIAGFIDGEGSFIISKIKSDTSQWGATWKIKCSISNTHKPTLKWIEAQIGGFTHHQSTYFGKYKSRLSKRIVHQLELGTGALRKFLPLLAPFLITKKDEANIILEALSLSKRGWGMTDERFARLLYLEHELKEVRERKKKYE